LLPACTNPVGPHRFDHDMDTIESLHRQGRKRLHPSLTNPNWLVLRRRREIFQQWISTVAGERLDVLDVGGRIQPYRPLVAERVGRYVAIDVRSTRLVDVAARGEQLPLASGSFDLALCTQVLEYVPAPAALIAEIYRVLKPGASLFLSAPAMAIQDADEECWRFFPGSLRPMLSAFREVEILPEGGSVAGFFRTINSGLNVLAKYEALRSVFQWTLCPVINLSGAALERIAGSKNTQLTTNYSAWARK
jgi:SAM-dependent methyltransferase